MNSLPAGSSRGRALVIPRSGFRTARALRLLLVAVLFCACPPERLPAQDGVKIRFGGGYDSLAPEQQALVRAWHEEYAKITGNQVDPKVGYDNLKLSVRTTFEAVTHALLHTPLTDADGKPLGTALSLVRMVESVHGEVPQTRGDEQFRVYVRLQDDALKRLYECTQFRRTADNGIYHIGYPINFRQQGSAPSIRSNAADCGKASGVEKIVCSSAELRSLDNKLNDSFQQAMARWSKDGADLVARQRAEQRAWLQERVKCAESPESHACLVTGYQRRIVQLQIQSGQLLSPKPVPYTCTGREHEPFTASYYNQTDPPSAVFTSGNRQIVALIARSGSGARYTADNFEYWEHQGEAAVTWSGDKFTCRPIR